MKKFAQDDLDRMLDKDYGVIGTELRDAFETGVVAESTKDQIRYLISKKYKFIHPKNSLNFKLEETLNSSMKKLNSILYKTNEILDDYIRTLGEDVVKDEEHKDYLEKPSVFGKIKFNLKKGILPFNTHRDSIHLEEIVETLLSHVENGLSCANDFLHPKGEFKKEIDTTLNEMSLNLREIQSVIRTQKRKKGVEINRELQDQDPGG